jgi:hypothetical protein
LENIIRHIKSRKLRWAGHVARVGQDRKVKTVLVGQPPGKIPFGKPRRRWEDGIRINLSKIDWGRVEWNQSIQDRDRWLARVNMAMNLWVLAPQKLLVIAQIKL